MTDKNKIIKDDEKTLSELKVLVIKIRTTELTLRRVKAKCALLGVSRQRMLGVMMEDWVKGRFLTRIEQEKKN
jgi:hypothetical protein